MNKKTPPFIAIVPYIYRHMDIAQIDINDLRSHLPKPAGKIKDLKKSDHIIIYPPVRTRGIHMLVNYIRFKYKIFKKVKCKISLMITEPIAHSKELYQRLWLVRFVFHHVFVRYQALENKYSNVLVVPTSRCWVGQLNNNDFLKKDKLLSIIASEQNHLPGHRLRHQIIREIVIGENKHQDMAVLGRSYRPFKDKKDGLLPYRFSIVIENCQEDDYFSEKLADSFACKTVPIYWGCPNIDYYFDTNGMIIFNTIDELKTILNKLKYDDYQKFIPSLEKNRQTALSLTNTSKVIADKLNEEKPKNERD